MADETSPKPSSGRQSPIETAPTQPLIAADSPPAELTEFPRDNASSTASISSSILEYRTIHGRTFHSEKHNTQYFTPNDEKQNESLDIVHHYLTLLLDGKLHLAPLKENIQVRACVWPQRTVADRLDHSESARCWLWKWNMGNVRISTSWLTYGHALTNTGSDFGDAHPNAEVTGIDLSPMQPTWVPPNVKFLVDDATQPWTWPDNSFDYVHIRFLNGALKDWPALFREAYRVCKPGGYVESGEFDPRYYCDDGTAADEDTIKVWNSVFEEGGKKLGHSFTVIEDGLQETGIREAGFEDIKAFPFKAPVGGWTLDKKLAEIGRFTQLTLENDMEGYTLFLWTSILGWPQDEYQVFLAKMRRIMRNTRSIHIYCKYKYVYGRKPETE
ncbi:S-adenosyl-L-methionine-dependent methyltransferase [Fusarium solani]|uniref:S-adenosyl-L-methionine-dependent methyltransferase n=1 Tax=Fusarium solani TaxID=169388 RepID=A0A9P9L0L0_FUSSL|nr:S-adenosyl-L-methionine-dependent methyltransferase [Fusarium solani]KAH7271841.1 S-adenosyl-L-methionine-dependent methyltransferase [Fusarium solani]